MRWICQTFCYLAQMEHLFESVSLIAMSQDLTILAVLEQNPPLVTLYILIGSMAEFKDIYE